MQEKDTNELEQELGRTHLNDYVQYALKNKASMISDATSFSSLGNCETRSTSS